MTDNSIALACSSGLFIGTVATAFAGADKPPPLGLLWLVAILAAVCVGVFVPLKRHLAARRAGERRRARACRRRGHDRRRRPGVRCRRHRWAARRLMFRSKAGCWAWCSPRPSGRSSRSAVRLIAAQLQARFGEPLAVAPAWRRSPVSPNAMSLGRRRAGASSATMGTCPQSAVSRRRGALGRADIRLHRRAPRGAPERLRRQARLGHGGHPARAGGAGRGHRGAARRDVARHLHDPAVPGRGDRRRDGGPGRRGRHGRWGRRGDARLGTRGRLATRCGAAVRRGGDVARHPQPLLAVRPQRGARAARLRLRVGVRGAGHHRARHPAVLGPRRLAGVVVGLALARVRAGKTHPPSSPPRTRRRGAAGRHRAEPSRVLRGRASSRRESRRRCSTGT